MSSKHTFGRIRSGKKYEQSPSKTVINEPAVSFGGKLARKLDFTRLPKVLVCIVVEYYGTLMFDLTRLNIIYHNVLNQFNEKETALQRLKIQGDDLMSQRLRSFQPRAFNVWNDSYNNSCSHFEVLLSSEDKDDKEIKEYEDANQSPLTHVEQGERPHLFYPALSVVRYLICRAEDFMLINRDTEQEAHATLTEIAIRNNITKPLRNSNDDELRWWELKRPHPNKRYTPNLSEWEGRRNYTRQIEFVKWISELFQTLLDWEQAGEIRCWVKDEASERQERDRAISQMTLKEQEKYYEAERFKYRALFKARAGADADAGDDDDDDDFECIDDVAYDIWVCLRSNSNKGASRFRVRLMRMTDNCAGC